MKKLVLGLTLLSASAFAADMECMVDTANWDQWRTGSCFAMEFTMDNRPNTAYWRIINYHKTISSVVWEEKTAGCSSSSTQCSKSITPYQVHKGQALILYADGTWERVSANASFETGF